MDLYITINYIILSIVFLLLSIEIMSSFTIFYDKNKFNDFKNLISPVWEMIGTFLIFFIVNTEVLYPDLLPIIVKLYTIPILLIGVFIIGRNAFLVYSEQIWKNKKIDSIFLARLYSISTFIIFILSLVVLTSIFTGIGVNNNLSNFSFIEFFSNYYTITTIFGIILILFGLSFIFYRIEKRKLLSPIFIIFGLAILIFSINNIGIYTNYIIYILALIFIIISLLYYFFDFAKRYIILPIIFLSFLSIVILNYGKVFNNQYLYTYLNSSYILSSSFIITIIGGTLITIMIILFIYMYTKDSKGRKGYY